MKVLVTGAGGQLGSELVLALDGKHEVIAATRQDCDVIQEDQVREFVLRERPQVIIHAAAFTNVDAAEQDPAAAYAVNARSAAQIAMAAEQLGSKMVYVSTDYVFDGRQHEPFRERDVPLPLNEYGRTKLRGERFTRRYCSRSFVVRTAWLYGRRGGGFVGKLLRRAGNEGHVPLVYDQYGSPTNAADLAAWIGCLIETDYYGIYHAVNQGWCSRYEFGLEIMRQAGLSNARLEPVETEKFRLPACRPAFSALDDEAARLHGLPRMRDWRDALRDYFLGESG